MFFFSGLTQFRGNGNNAVHIIPAGAQTQHRLNSETVVDQEQFIGAEQLFIADLPFFNDFEATFFGTFDDHPKDRRGVAVRFRGGEES